MKFLNKIGLCSLLFFSMSAKAMEFRVGPKIGLGVGTILGIKDVDSKVGIAPIVGVLTQYDFGSFAIDVGANYRYNIFGFSKKYDLDSNGSKETELTYALAYSSIEIPVTAYYKMEVGSGFFKFGGGAGLDFGFGKVKRAIDADSGNVSLEGDDTVPFSTAGLKPLDVYIIGALGYEFVFDGFALSIDLQPKYGLINKIKDSANAGVNKWNTLWFDLGIGFLF